MNFFVRLAKASLQKRSNTAVQRVFSAIAAGWISGRPVQLVASFQMIDTLSQVLQRLSVEDDVADEVARTVIDMMARGPEQLSPYVILGGSPDLTLKDAEDGGGLATAFAARANLLVTDNLADFMPAGCECFQTSTMRLTDGTERILTCQIVKRSDGHEIVVAHPVDVQNWVGKQLDATTDNVRALFTGRKHVPASSQKQP
ncbi:PIN domain-containing protein [Bosea sp. 47.2.35]|uniref:PIN domain-containing protein n=1 Tax=Bosea sp. 47.2.35 TaxID=2969304 RepID=UPI00214F7EAD|nr:PIN domain-containing protein [Bosea sp. 47.2.35]MCR4522974.1 PIN domain-containing protein [Bosea sp. 47.2.35]